MCIGFSANAVCLDIDKTLPSTEDAFIEKKKRKMPLRFSGYESNQATLYYDS